MQASRKALKFIDYMTEIDNRLVAVSHVLNSAERMRVLLQARRQEFAITAGVNGAKNLYLMHYVFLFGVKLQTRRKIKPYS